MSQSPHTALRVQRYEDGWEIINRMIREDMSWGGYERKCFHVQCAGGVFADLSAASGLDFLDDGRALSTADLDEDGRPDLVLRNRTAPQLRILRNVWPQPGPVVWLRLEGGKSNRDAIGARVSVRSGGAVKVKEVAAGSAFLSQSSRWLVFALGEGTAAASFEVRWPSGLVQPLGELAAGRRYRCREGDTPVAEPFRPRAPAPPDAAGEPEPAPQSSHAATWLIEPVPAPRLTLAAVAPREIAGKAVAMAGAGGKPRILHFVSIHCPGCAAEAPAVRDAETLVAGAGGEVVHVLADVHAAAGDLQAFVARAGYRSTVLHADERALSAYNVLHRHIWNRRRDLAVPASFLIDETGLVVKVYRGGAPASELAGDVRRIPRDAAARLALALPYPGTLFRQVFQRDRLTLGNAYFEAGLAELAAATFESALVRQSGDVDSLFNFAASLANAGRLEEAVQAYERVLSAAPALDDARNNLGILRARAGDREGARAAFQAITDRNPAHGEAVLNLSNALLESGDAAGAAAVCARALEHDPESAPFHRQLGYARYQAGDRVLALSSYERALALDPADRDAALGAAILLFAEGAAGRAKAVASAALTRHARDAGLLNVLGMAQDAAGETAQAVDSLRQSIAADPSFDRAYTNLARILAREGRTEEADAVLRRLLAEVPGHPGAIEMLGAR